MPSSTSSSEAAFPERPVPHKPWLRMLAVAAIVVAVELSWWEGQVRAMGYAPTYNDTPNLWATRRALASGAGPDQIVFVGASRTLFDMDLEVFREATGGPLPIQLATVGSNPKVILADLAADPTYAGTTIVGIVPGLVAAAGGPPVANPTKFVKHFHRWSPSDRMELPMVLWMQERFAFINSDLTLSALLKSGLDLPKRDDAYAPELPPYMYTIDRNRRASMIDKVVDDPAFARKIQQIWLPLFTPPARPSLFTQEQWDEMMKAGLEANIKEMADDAKAIVARGGKVIFSRLPSTDGVLELETRHAPRPVIWDRLLEQSGAPGIYFEDYPELRGFDCPEWSHLSVRDSVEYSKRLVKIMKAEGLL